MDDENSGAYQYNYGHLGYWFSLACEFLLAKILNLLWGMVLYEFSCNDGITPPRIKKLKKSIYFYIIVLLEIIIAVGKSIER